jgi:hypothetical protein
MKSHRHRRSRRIAALALAADAPLTAPAGAVPADDHGQPANAKIGDTSAAIGGAARTGLLIVPLAFLGTRGLAGPAGHRPPARLSGHLKRPR